MNWSKVALVAGLLAPVPAAAQQVSFDLDPQKAQQLGLDTAQLEADLSEAISSQLNLADPTAYMDQMAQAAAMSTKGMGVDYASNPKKFVFGGSIGSAVTASGLGFGRGDELLPTGGFAFEASLMAGLNLGVLTPGDEGVLDHVLIFVNGLGFRAPSGREFGGSMYNVGAHLQIEAIGPIDAKVVEWGGLDLTAGWEMTSYQLALAQGLPISVPVDPATIDWDATGTYTIDADSQSIPLEVSTNLRIAVVTAYVGAAYDIDAASASSSVGLSGPVSASAQGQTEELGTASVTQVGDGVALPGMPRAFVGAQANILVLKVYGHLNIGMYETFGGHVGVRIAM